MSSSGCCLKQNEERYRDANFLLLSWLQVASASFPHTGVEDSQTNVQDSLSQLSAALL